MIKKSLSLSSVIFIFLSLLPTVSAKSNLTEPYNKLFFEVLILSTIVFVLVVIMWVYNLSKFREGKSPEPKEYDPEFLKKMQITWVVVPILIGGILLALSLPALSHFQENLNYDGPAEEVVVEGTATWQWRFYYQGEVHRPVQDSNGISTTTIELQVDQTYRFILYSSADLIHSFFVPELNFKEDVVPHKNNTITITIEEVGEYEVMCAEYCGARHSMMRGIIRVVP